MIVLGWQLLSTLAGVAVIWAFTRAGALALAAAGAAACLGPGGGRVARGPCARARRDVIHGRCDRMSIDPAPVSRPRGEAGR